MSEIGISNPQVLGRSGSRRPNLSPFNPFGACPAPEGVWRVPEVGEAAMQQQGELFVWERPAFAAVARPSDPPKRAIRRDAKAEYEGLCQDRAWLASQWEALHVWLLKRQLHILVCPHTAPDEQADILAWMEAPLASGAPPPFSFQACVILYDPRIAPDEFGEAVRAHYQKRLQPRKTG